MHNDGEMVSIAEKVISTWFTDASACFAHALRQTQNTLTEHTYILFENRAHTAESDNDVLQRNARRVRDTLVGYVMLQHV